MTQAHQTRVRFRALGALTLAAVATAATACGGSSDPEPAANVDEAWARCQTEATATLDTPDDVEWVLSEDGVVELSSGGWAIPGAARWDGDGQVFLCSVEGLGDDQTVKVTPAG